MARRRENTRFLPGIPLPDTLTITHDASRALEGAEVVVLAVPMRRLAENLERLEHSLPPSAILVSGIKGLDPLTGARVSEALGKLVGSGLTERFAVVSGPNLAREIAAREPSATVVASTTPAVARTVQRALGAPWFRAYTSDDVIGVELAGALKNVIGIGAGMADGLRYGQNAKAVFMTRGLAEMTRLGVAAGANPLTFSGLAGVGDLIATGNSAKSRNHYVGDQLAQGRSLDEITAQMVMVAEGVEAAPGALQLANRLQVEMPIIELMNDVLFNGLSVAEAGDRLMSREASHELRGLAGGIRPPPSRGLDSRFRGNDGRGARNGTKAARLVRDHRPRRAVQWRHNGHRLPAGISRNVEGVIRMGDASPNGPRTEKVRAS